jgi:ParB-like chromosome segregation protein Spo0J
VTKIEFETVPLGFLRPYERNARLHSSRQIGRIAKSIKEFGFTNPPLIDERGEIIAGHGRGEGLSRIDP